MITEIVKDYRDFIDDKKSLQSYFNHRSQKLSMLKNPETKILRRRYLFTIAYINFSIKFGKASFFLGKIMKENFKAKAFIIFILILLAYSNSFQNRFVWDDDFLIVANPYIRDFSSITNILTCELFYTVPVWRSYYRPLQTLSYLLDYSIFKLKPWGFHITSLLFHFLNAILVLTLLNILTKDNFISLVGALFFSLHPAQVESVTYLSGRADLILGTFFLSALILYIIHDNYPPSSRDRIYLASLLLFLLSLLSKELALILPFVLILYDYFNKKIKAGRYIPYFLVSLAYLAVRIIIANLSRHSLFTFKDIIIFNPIKIFKVIITYAKIIVLPINLHIGRLLPKDLNALDLACLTVFLLTFIICVRLYRDKKNIIYFAIFWFCLILVCQLNIFLRLAIVHTADHFLYLPLIGFSLIVGFLISRLHQKNKLLGKTFLGSLVIFYGLLTFSQNIIWKDSITLFRWTLANSPDNFLIRYNLGLEYEKRGLNQEAMEEFKQALKYNPNFTDAIASLGNIYFKLGRYSQAKEQYHKALQLNPSYKLLWENYKIILKESGGEDVK